MSNVMTWDRFTELLGDSMAIDIDGCVVYSPIDEDGVVTVTVNNEDFDTETLFFVQEDNEAIRVDHGHNTFWLISSSGETHTCQLLGVMNV